MDEGYSMIRTEAPKDLEGRGWANLARTTPELPRETVSVFCGLKNTMMQIVHTVRAGNLAPDHADLGAADLLLALVHKGDLLAEVEAVIMVSSADP